ncbi:hypothetical protein A9986_08205 [Solibacillus silvestris]|nr:hypothetical protein A9986_08205 [Solibacillus silvestris]
MLVTKALPQDVALLAFVPSLSHVLVPWESPSSLRTTNFPSISKKGAYKFKNTKDDPHTSMD